MHLTPGVVHTCQKVLGMLDLSLSFMHKKGTFSYLKRADDNPGLPS